MIQGASAISGGAWQWAYSASGNAAATASSGTSSADAAATSTATASSQPASGKAGSGSRAQGLTPEQQRQVRALEQVDRQVRAHEQAHMAVGGNLIRGGTSYTYETGPDGKQYAVAGEVSIDVSAASTPQATEAKAERIRAAALAPADPSAQDFRVAAMAEQMQLAAQLQLARVQGAAASGATAASNDAASRAYRLVGNAVGSASGPGAAGASSLGKQLDIYA